MNFSYKESVAEVVEEDKHEDDDHGGMVNLRRRQAKFKMLQDKNEFNKKCKRNRSTDFLKEKGAVQYSTMHYIGDVSEDDEELISDSSFEKQQQQTDQNKNTSKGKIYSLGYLSKNIWNNKIYSDDFDVDFEILKNDQIQRFKLGSVVNSAIQEDVESEMANQYFSDNSSSSYLATRLRKFSLDLQKFVDKSDNESSVLSMKSLGGTGPNKQSKLGHYQSNVSEPILEVDDENMQDQKLKLISESIQKRRKNSRHIDIH